MNFRPGACGALLLAALAVTPVAGARAQADQQLTVDRALKTVGDLTHDKAFGNAHQLLGRARAVLIVPRLFKGGFIVGGEGGTGVLLARVPGGWSDPAFYAIGSGSLGFQAGLEQSEMVLLIMTQKGLDAVMRDQFKVGAQAGIAVANLGSGVEGAVSGGGPDIVVWSSSSGVYAGVALDGSIIRAQPEDDARYYGRALTTRDIVYRRMGVAPRANALRSELSAIS